MSNVSSLKATEKANTPISSLIDVVFLLVMFFIVTSAIEQDAIDQEVNLAKARDMQPLKNKILKKIVIDVTQEKKFKIKNKAYQLESLVNYLIKQTKNSNSLPIIIRSDRFTPFQGTNSVLEKLKNLKLKNIKLSVEGEKR